MSQTRKGSLIETLINVLIGFIVSFFANLVILPIFGHGSPTLLNNFGMTAVFTVLSIVRGYAVRRYFNSLIVRTASKLAGESGSQ